MDAVPAGDTPRSAPSGCCGIRCRGCGSGFFHRVICGADCLPICGRMYLCSTWLSVVVVPDGADAMDLIQVRGRFGHPGSSAPLPAHRRSVAGVELHINMRRTTPTCRDGCETRRRPRARWDPQPGAAGRCSALTISVNQRKNRQEPGCGKHLLGTDDRGDPLKGKTEPQTRSVGCHVRNPVEGRNSLQPHRPILPLSPSTTIGTVCP